MPKVFISYLREDSDKVERLCRKLEKHGIEYWIDKRNLAPGQPWEDAIRQAISDGDFFLACFSEAHAAKSRSYMNEELELAIGELRKRPRNSSRFIPILFSGEVPDWNIGAGRTLRSIQWVHLDPHHWDDGIQRLVKVLGGTPAQASSDVIARLNSKSLVARLAAVDELGADLPSKSALEALLAALEHPDQDLAGRAASYLARSGERGLNAVIEALRREDVSAMRRAAFATVLAYSLPEPSREAAAAIASLLRQENAAVRMMTAIMLGNMGEPTDIVVPALSSVLSDPFQPVAEEARKALIAIGDPGGLRAVELAAAGE